MYNDYDIGDNPVDWFCLKMSGGQKWILADLEPHEQYLTQRNSKGKEKTVKVITKKKRILKDG